MPFSKRQIAAGKLFLDLPEPLQRLIAWLGPGADLRRIQRFLLASEPLAKFPVRFRKEIIRRQIRSYLKGEALGSYRAGFYPFLAPSAAWPDYPDLVAAAGKAPPETFYPVLSRQTATANAPGSEAKAADRFAPPIRAALHIHAHYLDGIGEVLQILRSNQARPDLVVTGAEDNREALLKALEAYSGQSRFVPCSNLGRDILPFLRQLPELTQRYDLIGHIHLKRSAWAAESDFAKHWLTYLLSATIGNLAQGLRSIDDILADFAARKGEVAIYLPHMPSSIGWNKNREIAAPIFADLSRAKLPEEFLFSAGTMFWAKSDYLRRFCQIDLPWEELVPEPIGQDGTVLHAIERLFGAVAYAEQLPIVILPPDETPFVMSLRLARQITQLTQS